MSPEPWTGKPKVDKPKRPVKPQVDTPLIVNEPLEEALRKIREAGHSARAPRGSANNRRFDLSTHPNAGVAATAGALVTLIVYLVGFAGIQPPAEVGAAATTLIVAGILLAGRKTS